MHTQSLTKMLNRILQKIEQASIITIYRHEYPDMDAIGSQLGLQFLLKSMYAEKSIYVMGECSGVANVYVNAMDEVSDETIQSSLAIILDTANAKRVDDQRFSLAKDRIRIDHHILQEEFCETEWIDEKASATCEMLALLCKQANLTLPKQAAQLFYNGIVADSIRFTVSSVRPETLIAASYLLQQQADVLVSEEENFSKSYDDFTYENVVRHHAIRKENFLYSINEIEDYQSCHLSFSQAKEKVYVLAEIREIKNWALFTRMEDGIHYSASLRARDLDVRSIAQQFNGGGHRCAAGIKNLTIDQVHEIIDLCAQLSE